MLNFGVPHVQGFRFGPCVHIGSMSSALVSTSSGLRARPLVAAFLAIATKSFVLVDSKDVESPSSRSATFPFFYPVDVRTSVD